MNKEETMREPDSSTRRQFLGLAGGAAAFSFVTSRPAEATPAMLASAIQNVVGAAVVKTGKVKLDIPPLVENGNTVPMTVSVASPMTSDDYVKSIHVFNEKNPQPNVGNFYLSPRAGRAQVSTRIRLADSQKIVAIAQLSDGSFWQTSIDVVVTLAACTEEVI
jgi:sulfur-oxidizing protein SoxY